jgi:hypothetical protein
MTNVMHKFFCINTASGNSHSMLVAEMCAGWNQPAHIALDNGLQAIGIFFHLIKAYDVLNQKVLLDKLHSYGVRGNINSWFKS